jgi:hypothetical protein
VLKNGEGLYLLRPENLTIGHESSPLALPKLSSFANASSYIIKPGGLMESGLVLLCTVSFFLLLSMLFLASAIKIVREDSRLTVYRLGRKIGDKGPGLVLLIPFVDRGELKKLGEPNDSPSYKYVGAVGETLTSVFRDGKVLFSSGEWDAVSQTPIQSGRRVRVVRMILEVEEE